MGTATGRRKVDGRRMGEKLDTGGSRKERWQKHYRDGSHKWVVRFDFSSFAINFRVLRGASLL